MELLRVDASGGGGSEEEGGRRREELLYSKTINKIRL